ncbi:hypothetical protein [Limnohabitans sp.]|uniref:hypothetical protein n=1 Tax=Limnohabitans sp. TaxID=1907725 RepID=UPI003342C222
MSPELLAYLAYSQDIAPFIKKENRKRAKKKPTTEKDYDAGFEHHSPLSLVDLSAFLQALMYSSAQHGLRVKGKYQCGIKP